MKDKTTSNQHSINQNFLWKQLPIKQSSPPVQKQKRRGRISDFLKNIHTSQDQYYEASESEVLSVMDVKYSECSSNEIDFKEKRFFTQLLLKALKQVWAQLYEEATTLRKASRLMMEEVGESFIRILQEKSAQIKSLLEQMKVLEICNSNLKSENENLREKIEKYEETNQTDLVETNKELRIYLKNMNQIMMSYHTKNQELEESIRQMEVKYQIALKSESISKKQQTDQSLSGTSFSHTLTRISQIKTQEQDQNQSYQEQHSVQLLPRNSLLSPQSSSKKRFCRKANLYSPASTVRHPPNKIHQQIEDSAPASGYQNRIKTSQLKEPLRKKQKNPENINSNKLGFLKLSFF